MKVSKIMKGEEEKRLQQQSQSESTNTLMDVESGPSLVVADVVTSFKPANPPNQLHH